MSSLGMYIDSGSIYEDENETGVPLLYKAALIIILQSCP